MCQNQVHLLHGFLHIPCAVAAAGHHETIAGFIGFDPAFVVVHIDDAFDQINQLIVRRVGHAVLVWLALPNAGIQLSCLVHIVAFALLFRVATDQFRGRDVVGWL